MKIVYRSRIDWFMKSALVLIAVTTFAPIYWMEKDNEPFYSILTYVIIMVLVLVFMLHLIRTTHYTFEEDKLICKSGFFRKSIDYDAIRKIESGTQLYAGWKMSLALKGIIIHYDRFDDILLSPENEKQFIQELLKRNPSIELKIS
jgi:hypothetical protein